MTIARRGKPAKGFTLIELLIVIAIIAVLAAIVFAAVNPARRAAQARNARRAAETRTIADAIRTYSVDNEGLPPGIDENWRQLGTDLAGCDSPACPAAGSLESACLDLTVPLVGPYIASIPYDPKTGDEQQTRYAVKKVGVSEVSVVACDAENTSGSGGSSGGDTTGPIISFTDDVEAGPVASDTVVASWGDATVKKWDYDADGACSEDSGDYLKTDADSMDQSDDINNGQWICLYAEDSLGNKSALASMNDINIEASMSMSMLGWWGKDDLGNSGWHDPESGRTGETGNGDGQFSQQQGVAVDSSNNVYVADAENNRIQKFTSGGTFVAWLGYDGSTIGWHTGGAGTSGTGDGQMYGPYDVAVDSAGNIYVADSANYRIQKFTSGGTFVAWLGYDGSTIGWHTGGAGTSGTGDGQFKILRGVVVDSLGDIYVSDSFNSRIQKFNSSGTMLGWIGADTEGGSGWHNPGSGKVPTYGYGNGQLYIPEDIAVDSSDNVYATDYGNHRVQKFTSAGAFVAWLGYDGSTIGWHTGGAGVSGSLNGQFDAPLGVAIDSSGNVYVGDTYSRLQVFASSGTFLGWFGKSLTVSGWHAPDGEQGSEQGSDDGQFRRVNGIAFDSFGKIHVSDVYNSRIQKLSF